MIRVNFKNIELTALIKKGKSSEYGKLKSKKTFLKVLRSFFDVIEILDNTEDLQLYKLYNYKKGEEISSITIKASKIEGILLFRESIEGKYIDILELKY